MERAFGFDEVAIVPGRETVDPDEVDISGNLAGIKLQIPFLASAMDGVVDPKFAILLGKLGGLAVLNLEGIYTRYENYEEILNEIIASRPEEVTPLLPVSYTHLTLPTKA